MAAGRLGLGTPVGAFYEPSGFARGPCLQAITLRTQLVSGGVICVPMWATNSLRLAESQAAQWRASDTATAGR